MRQKAKAEKVIKELRRSINLVIGIDQKVNINSLEKELAREAYFALNTLRNSLHRHLIVNLGGNHERI